MKDEKSFHKPPFMCILPVPFPRLKPAGFFFVLIKLVIIEIRRKKSSF